MTENASLISRFEEERPRLRAVAYRMLGSLSEADDAVQEAWLRLDRSDPSDVENLGAWLTTVVSRLCLNMLRSRDNRREEPLDAYLPEPTRAREDVTDPEEEALLADAVGVAMLVVLDTLTPPERLAFVLHDMFQVPFDEIGPMLERTPAAARQLASRARRRARGNATPATAPDPGRQHRVVEAFLAATRAGDFEALVALLHPGVVLSADRMVVPTPEPISVSGARAVAEGAMAATGRARFTGLALLDGTVGLAMAPRGRLRLVLAFTVTDDDRIARIEIIAERARLRGVEVAVVGDAG
ncbi:sigma-70 family RNA polymerase sigma factor [Streptomyces sp. 3MP-14]|uniref:Sigma-70 family RNA polymerase sigma factor n=1 Tax=Streptomyces mimosae TaxID=2586635 RepID=A0A5N5ZZH8_9ACTN|nr:MULTISPECIES: sigma-70 family RNA polymerase sigma factor [Streptomyces]KAB8161897.1 sigma-70 family RNA polymerase sigma factor [Streptomyces mimosae]KAB8173595.1 sigma-70 family RNA polymerase sigma factor [Streptomyces sp. 3MP-14]